MLLVMPEFYMGAPFLMLASSWEAASDAVSVVGFLSPSFSMAHRHCYYGHFKSEQRIGDLCLSALQINIKKNLESD